MPQPNSLPALEKLAEPAQRSPGLQLLVLFGVGARMKPFLAGLLLGVTTSAAAAASSLLAEYFLYPRLNFSHWSNYCRRSDMSMLHYAGLMEALDAYVAERRAAGALDGRKLEIVYYGGLSMGPAIELSRNRRGYHITTRAASDLTLHRLVRLVEYFAADGWRSFCCYDILKLKQDPWKALNATLDREVGEPDLSFFAGRRSVVYEVGDLQVVYENEPDRLVYLLAGERLDLEPSDPIPVRIGNRYLFGSREFLHVYEDGREILSRPQAWAKHCDEPLRARAYRKWVNFGCEGRTRLSYSYAANRFFEVVPDFNTKGRFGAVIEQQEYADPQCSDVPGEGGVHPPPLRVLRGPGR